MPRDIIAGLMSLIYRTPHDMLLHVKLVDRETDQCYHFKYDKWALDPEVAVEMARAELARMWRPQ